MEKAFSSIKPRLRRLPTIASPAQFAVTYDRAIPFSRNRFRFPKNPASGGQSDSEPSIPGNKRNNKDMESSGGGRGVEGVAEVQSSRVPLSVVVADCVKRWFRDSLKEARSGDVSMQVLVGQMYFSGYGIPRDPKKGKIWISRAARCRSSAWIVSEKRPGYNVSDSDSDELKIDS